MDLKLKCGAFYSYEPKSDDPSALVEVVLQGVSEEHLVVALGEQLSEETVATLCDEPLSLLDRIKAMRQKVNA